MLYVPPLAAPSTTTRELADRIAVTLDDAVKSMGSASSASCTVPIASDARAAVEEAAFAMDSPKSPMRALPEYDVYP